ncbi:MFS transporter [Paraburkholderia sp.]|uniref:MFS transporter n=1 Tax=Paraburkholderia sp. TaxID=1926495 RepID=UPI0023882935|nr:MFS transporter [Paraburkholderia sp.]MDE1184284.1 MFS transporter [Paraburkholderia sp.]
MSHVQGGKTRSLAILLLCQVGAMSVWFSSSAVVAIVKETRHISALDATLLTSAVQAGFVAGTIGSALLSLADRYDPRRLFMISALIAAVATACLTLLEPAGPVAIALRFLTGICMAGVYPVGMRLAATWANRDLGLLIGLLVGALTFGSASPHLLAALGGSNWRAIYGVAACCAFVSGFAILLCGIGPGMARATRIQWTALAAAWRNPSLRLANLGYLGHMWELYAMWAWLAVFLDASFTASGVMHPRQAAEWLTFGAVAAGALGAWLGGMLADRFGRTTVTMTAMAVSGACAALMGWLFGAPAWLVGCIALCWGVSVIADSAQFSASIAELAEPSSIGTLLTAQTCAGFLLTLVSIHLVPDVVSVAGWAGAFTVLAVGPLLGCVAMARLRRHPDARRLAGGKG